jgi:hypothetical protein
MWPLGVQLSCKLKKKKKKKEEEEGRSINIERAISVINIVKNSLITYIGKCIFKTISN